jgi:hypothetical protein
MFGVSFSKHKPILAVLCCRIHVRKYKLIPMLLTQYIFRFSAIENIMRFDKSILADHIDATCFGEETNIIPVSFLCAKSN